jgi:hypothetical protein
MTFYVDGSEKASFAENVPGGKVGLCTLDDECYFDNFKLTDLNASVVRVLPGSFTTNGPERLLLQMEGDQVGFTLSGAAAGELVLYGPAGERLCSLTCRANRTEHYSVAGLPSGAYYYGINTGGATRYGMMVIVK